MSATLPGFETPATSYAQAGVNVSLGDTFSAYAGKIARDSWANNKFVNVRDFSGGSFRGPRAMQITGYPKEILVTLGSDGSGTKPIINASTMTHENGAFDLIAMLDGDVTRWGGLPLAISDDLSVNSLGSDENSIIYRSFCKLMDGLGVAAAESNIVILSGETAELSHCITSEIQTSDRHTKYVWSGSMVGLLDPDRLIDGRKLRHGHVLISLECFLRANGVSMIRKLFRVRLGERWYEDMSSEALALKNDAARPSIVFNKFFVEANGWNNEAFEPVLPISAIFHITGGGLKSKLAEVLKQLGFSATLDELHESPYCVKEAVKEFNIGNEEAHEIFCCGNGTVFAIPESHADQAISLAQQYGFNARVCGRVEDGGDSPKVKIRSKFDGEWFEM